MLDRLKSFVCGLALIALLGLGCLAAAHAWELTARWIGEAELRNWRQKVLEEQSLPQRVGDDAAFEVGQLGGRQPVFGLGGHALRVIAVEQHGPRPGRFSKPRQT